MKWRKKYLITRLRHIKHNTGKMLDIYDELVKKSDRCSDTKLNRFDFLCSYLMFGVEPEDYFSFDFFEHRNPFFRNHHVTRGRLNFIKGCFNTEEGISILNSKSEFNKIYGEYLGRKWCCPDEVDEDTFVESLTSEGKEVFVKLLSGFGGKGAFKASAGSDSLHKLYKDLTSGEEKYIVEEYIDQKGFLRDVNPSSLNTVRVTTVRAGKEVAPLYAYFRAGGADSPVDNLHSGGVRYTIDIRDGELQKGINYTNNDIEIHPSSGVKVAGYKIPNWNEVLEYAKNLQRKAPEGANLVGWDICINLDKCYVIEGNAGPGFPQELKFVDNTWMKVRKYLNAL